MKADAPASSTGFHLAPVAAAAVMAHARLVPGLEVLIPFAGRGGLLSLVAAVTRAVDCIEPDSEKWAALASTARHALCVDFDVYHQPGGHLAYDRVLMAAPMSARADTAHVRHGLSFLRPGGWLAAAVCERAVPELAPMAAGGIHDIPGGPGFVVAVIPAQG